jgi:hypothetical protein
MPKAPKGKYRFIDLLVKSKRRSILNKTADIPVQTAKRMSKCAQGIMVKDPSNSKLPKPKTPTEIQGQEKRHSSCSIVKKPYQ